MAEARRFRDARDWSQFHTPKNLAAAIVEEVADVFLFALLLADRLDIDVGKAIVDTLGERDASCGAQIRP